MVHALIFDCDGVLADTERFGHLPAFNQTFAEFALPVRWSEEEYGDKLKIAGGKERMASMLTDDFVRQAHLPTDAEGQRQMLAAWHKRKTAIYKEIVAEGRLPGRPGIARIVTEAIANSWKLAVASTSAEESVRAILEYVVGRDHAAHFEVLAGDIVPKKKPTPDIYQLTLERLHISPQEALAVEDSRNGLLAAVGAGLRCVVTLSSYTEQEDMHEALLVVSHLGEPDRPMHLLANRGRATPATYITLRDLAACLT
ncbi:MAG: HAD-IA family hydrolase [Chloroflexota bacterium]|nr:HAD-IA family hydrolase [Chloroflexota bacterium]